MKRFQECNRIEKFWRYRWYILIPFHYIYLTIKKEKVWEDDYNEEEGTLEPTGRFHYSDRKLRWRIAKSNAQMKMNWFYTTEEVFENIKNKHKK